MAAYESILCVKPQVHVFRIPPRPSNRGYRAADWKLDEPDWTGRMRVVSQGKDLSIKLEDKTSGELFARCPVEQYPGIAVESVTDSSRYFVLRIMNDNGRSAFIGLGFEDRGDSFDLNVALQDHFKHLKHEKDAEKAVEELQKGPKLDLGFKEGQTIRINISTKKNSEENDGTPKKSRPKGAAGGGMGILPPPPGGIKLLPPGGASQSIGSSNFQSSSKPQQPMSNPTFPTQPSTTNTGTAGSNVDLLFDLGMPSSNAGQVQGQSQGQSSLQGFDSDFDLLSSSNHGGTVQPAGGSADPWGEFAGARQEDVKVVIPMTRTRVGYNFEQVVSNGFTDNARHYDIHRHILSVAGSVSGGRNQPIQRAGS